MVRLTAAEYEFVRATSNRFAILPNDENPESEVVVSECARYAVVDKVEGWGLRIARETDPRSSSGWRTGHGVTAGTVTATARDDDGTWLVKLHGDHDLSTWPSLERQTSKLWAKCKVVVIDLSDVTFIDSGVIRWLLAVESALEASGAFTLSIVGGPPGSAAHRLFGLLRMSHVLACYATLPRLTPKHRRPSAFCRGLRASSPGAMLRSALEREPQSRVLPDRALEARAPYSPVTLRHTALALGRALTQRSAVCKLALAVTAGDDSIIEVAHMSERELQHEREAARQTSDLIATVSHELRTPLASVLGFMELMLHRDLEDDIVRATCRLSMTRRSVCQS